MKKLLFVITFLNQFMVTLNAQGVEGTSAYNQKKTMGRTEVKITAMRDFTNRFKDVDNATWSSNEDRMRAKFTREDILFMIDYDKKGRWVSTIRVYNENNLERGLKKIVKGNYIDYSIVKVIEVKIGKSHVHFIKLENESSLLTLHIMDGEITEMENFRKG